MSDTTATAQYVLLIFFAGLTLVAYGYWIGKRDARKTGDVDE